MGEGHPTHHGGHPAKLHHGLGSCSNNIFAVAVGTWQTGGNLTSPVTCTQAQEGPTVAWDPRICAWGLWLPLGQLGGNME